MKLVYATAILGLLLTSSGGQEAPSLPTNDDLPALGPPPGAPPSVPTPLPQIPQGPEFPQLNPPPATPLDDGPPGTDPEELLKRFSLDYQPTAGLPTLQAPPESANGKTLPPGLAASGLEWHGNPHNARVEAIKEKKYFMILFGAWEWNPVSDELAWELFATEEFSAYAKAHFALSYLDFPKKAHETHEKLLAFREIYKVRGFPTVILFRPDGTPFYRDSGYRKGRARPYLEAIQSAVAAQRQADYEEREILIRRGYRDWTGNTGTEIFARLTGRDDEQRLRLTTPNGSTYHIAEENFSEDDRLLLPTLEKNLSR